MGRLSLTTKFRISSLVIILAIGHFMIAAIVGEFQQKEFHDYSNCTLTFRARLVERSLQTSDFVSGNQRLARPEFRQFMKDESLPPDTMFVKIWRRNGEIAYSSDADPADEPQLMT